jgi:NAD(P)H-dependent FMN reductase
MADIPAFSPDRDVEPPPPPVVTWRAALATADGVVFSTPEYAHGIPGALKNALDWVVGSGELYNKPVALLNPSPESAFAHPQLAEVLRTMGARLSEDTVVTVRVPRGGASPEAIIADATIAASVRAALGALFAG